jgi:Zn finger protein HypA/HybF involved in hydrogenase expression
VRKLYLPIYAGLNPSSGQSSALQWFKFPSNLCLVAGYATLLPQGRSIFVALLCQCALLGSPVIEIEDSMIGQLSKVDARTVPKHMEDLLASGIVVEHQAEIETEIEKREIEKPRSSSRDGPVIYSEKYERRRCPQCQGKGFHWKRGNKVGCLICVPERRSSCEICGGDGEALKGARVVKCTNCLPDIEHKRRFG